jgi:uncharacterized protein
MALSGTARAEWDSAMVARQHGDLGAAFEGFKQEADSGAADAQDVVGEMLMKGQGVPKDQAAGVGWLRRAAEGGSVPGMLAYGSAALGGLGMERDVAVGVQWMTRAAKAGNLAAMLALGDGYEQGSAVPRDVAAAQDWFQKAAQSGDADGMLRLADLLLSPSAGDDRAGMEWLTKAAEAGQVAAQTRLALILYDGAHGMPRDEATASRWAQKAGIRDIQAAALLCTLSIHGIDGQAPDPALGIRWCAVVAQSGQPEAMVTLARFYLDGTGTWRDPSSALMWASIAADQATGATQQDAVRLRDTASDALSAPQRVAAQARASAWRPMR